MLNTALKFMCMTTKQKISLGLIWEAFQCTKKVVCLLEHIVLRLRGSREHARGLYCSVQHGRDVESSSSGQASGFSALAAARYRLP